MGSALEAMSGDVFYDVVAQIESVLGKGTIDGRLAIQYAVSIVCAQDVCVSLHFY